MPTLAWRPNMLAAFTNTLVLSDVQIPESDRRLCDVQTTNYSGGSPDATAQPEDDGLRDLSTTPAGFQEEMSHELKLDLRYCSVLPFTFCC